MQSVDDQLRPAPDALKRLSKHSFVCHACEKIFAARSDELYYFPARDLPYHRHGNEFHRALVILENGAIEIAYGDSVEDDVLQAYKLELGATKQVEYAGDLQELRAASRKFFDSIKKQKRKIVAVRVHLRIGN